MAGGGRVLRSDLPTELDLELGGGVEVLEVLGRRRKRASTHNDDEIHRLRVGSWARGRGSTALGSRNCRWDQRGRRIKGAHRQ
jgi:hypothetical protein